MSEEGQDPGLRERLSRAGRGGARQDRRRAGRQPDGHGEGRVRRRAREGFAGSGGGALGIPSAADIERLTRRLRSVSQRLEGIEDSVDRLDERLESIERASLARRPPASSAASSTSSRSPSQGLAKRRQRWQISPPRAAQKGWREAGEAAGARGQDRRDRARPRSAAARRGAGRGAAAAGAGAADGQRGLRRSHAAGAAPPGCSRRGPGSPAPITGPRTRHSKWAGYQAPRVDI